MHEPGGTGRRAAIRYRVHDVPGRRRRAQTHAVLSGRCLAGGRGLQARRAPRAGALVDALSPPPRFAAVDLFIRRGGRARDSASWRPRTLTRQHYYVCVVLALPIFVHVQENSDSRHGRSIRGWRAAVVRAARRRYIRLSGDSTPWPAVLRPGVHWTCAWTDYSSVDYLCAG